MRNPTSKLHANSDDDMWLGWGPCREFAGLEPGRALPPPGSEVELYTPHPAQGPCVLTLVFNTPISSDVVKALHLKQDVERRPFHLRPELPYLAYTFLRAGAANASPPTAALRLVVDRSNWSGPREAAVSSIAILPLPGMRSPLWLSPLERAARLLTGRSSAHAKADFPYSHFDGVEYLERNPDVKDAMLTRRCPSALAHYLKFGRKEGRRITLATRSTPNPGSLLNLANHLRTQSDAHRKVSQAISQESELLLLQLHQVQEELEQYFLENQKLQDAAFKLTALQAQHFECVASHEALVAEHDDLSTPHTLLAESCQELESKNSSLAAKRDELSAEKDLFLAQLHNAQEELEQSFLENRKLRESQQKLATLESQHSELVARNSSLVTSEQALAAKLAEAEKDRQELATARDGTARERDELKKTASERAMRIAELEAQVADLAERQNQIDAEMAKAEGQLDMLKDLLRPALA
jgi:hypothetical protein